MQCRHDTCTHTVLLIYYIHAKETPQRARRCRALYTHTVFSPFRALCTYTCHIYITCITRLSFCIVQFLSFICLYTSYMGYFYICVSTGIIRYVQYIFKFILFYAHPLCHLIHTIIHTQELRNRSMLLKAFLRCLFSCCLALVDGGIRAGQRGIADDVERHDSFVEREQRDRRQARGAARSLRQHARAGLQLHAQQHDNVTWLCVLCYLNTM